MCKFKWGHHRDCNSTTCESSIRYVNPVPQTKPAIFDHWVKHYDTRRVELLREEEEMLARHAQEIESMNKNMILVFNLREEWVQKRLEWEEGERRAALVLVREMEEKQAAQKKLEAVTDPELRNALILHGYIKPDNIPADSEWI